MSRSLIRFRLQEKHREGCLAAAEVASGLWASPWYEFANTAIRGRDGRQGSNTTVWLGFPCNDRDCPAVLMVLAEDVLEYLRPYILVKRVRREMMTHKKGGRHV